MKADPSPSAAFSAFATPRRARNPGITVRSRAALEVVLAYMLFASLWILLSDRVMGWLLRDPDMLLLASTLKGWAFVVVSAALLYLLLRRRVSTSILPLQVFAHGDRGARPSARAMTLFVTLAVAVAVLVASSIWSSVREERNRAYAQLRAIAQAKAREIWVWHQERLGDVNSIRDVPHLQTLWRAWRERGDVQSQRELRQFLSHFVDGQVFPRAEIVDGQGRRWFASPVADEASARATLPLREPDMPRADAVLAEGVQRALRENHSLRVGPWRDAQGRLRLAFVGPISAPADIAVRPDRAAALVLHIDPSSYLHPTLGDWPMLQQSAEAVLFRREGEQVVFLSELRYEQDAALRKTLALSVSQLAEGTLRGLTPTGTLIEGLDYRGVPSYAVMQRIGDTEWWLAVKQDRAELLHDAMTSGVWMTLTAALGLLALGVVLYLRDERRRRLHSLRDIEELQRTKQALSESEALYRLLADNSSDVVWLYDLESDRYLYASPAVRLLGYDPEQANGMSFKDLLPPDVELATRERLNRRITALLAGDESQRTSLGETPVLSRDGTRVMTEVVTTLLTDERTGRVTRVLGVSRDITQRKQDQDQLIRLSQAIEQSPASVVITNLAGNIEYVNPAFEIISGYARAEVMGKNPRVLNSGRTPGEVYDSMWFTLSAGEAWHGELINRAKDGREFVVSMTIAPVRNTQGEVAHYLAVQLDVTSQKNAEEKARQLAWFHPLTGLPNRHRLLLDLKDVLESHEQKDGQAAAQGEQCALLLLDLDRFQTVNDALGPATGDHLLQQVSRRFASVLPPEAHLAHLNADEFAVLLPAKGAADHAAADESAASGEALSARALRLAQNLHEALAAPIQLGRGENIAMSCCIGITLLPHTGEENEDRSHEDTPEDVLRRVDTALHRAKENRGKEGNTGQTAFFDASMEQIVSRRFLIERDLRRGLAAGELRVYLQPQVDADGRMVSAEALVRWQHPVLGLMPPGVFIPVAEESELITEVGRWVLQSVCAYLGALRKRELRLPIAVNISPRQFRQSNFVQQVQETLRAHGAAPGDLIIEVTESILMEQMESVTQKMSQLASVGVKFSLDDFGTGYSSLAYLKRLPIDEIKIDRSFVQDAPNDPNDAALVDAILSVARHLRLKVVAEGVETRAQAEFLQARGHIVQQGYLHGRPAPAEDVLALWEKAQFSA